MQVRRDGAVGGSRMAVRDDSATACEEMRRRCTNGHFHVQRSPDQQMSVRVRRAIVTSTRQTRDRLGTAESVAAVDDMLGEEESDDVLSRPLSSVQSNLRRLPGTLGILNFLLSIWMKSLERSFIGMLDCSCCFDA